MSHFILPVTIESRKILFLDLHPHNTTEELSGNIGEDEYVVEIQPTHSRNILSIPLHKYIQSVHEEVDDLLVNDVRITVAYEEKEHRLNITFDSGGKAQQVPTKQTILLSNSLTLKIDQTDKEMRLMLSSSPGLDMLAAEYVFVSFSLKVQSDQLAYSALIKLHLVTRKQIMVLGFDFGSEASQIHEGSFAANDDAAINSGPADLFAAIRARYPQKIKRNSEYAQHDDANLYRSIFFLKRKIRWPDYIPHTPAAVPQSEFDTLTDRQVMDDTFHNTWLQIPNLKLIHNNTSITNRFDFSIDVNGQSYTQNLSDLRSNIYKTLLKEMISSHLTKKQIRSNVYLRFTFLAPNIYDIKQIQETKRTIRKIILHRSNPFSQHIKGLEISSLSESDSAFLGHLVEHKVNGGDYFIVIDCGKGTTDFSVIQAQKDNAAIFKSVYRSGFAGAGNQVTFAFLQSALHFLRIQAASSDAAARFESFIRQNLARSSQNKVKTDLFALAEKWKKNYDQSLTATQIEKLWRSATSQNLKLDNAFTTDWEPEELLTFLDKPQYVADWDNYVEAAVNSIVKKLSISLSPVVAHVNKKGKCAGFVFTGRGFKFKPLKRAILDALQSISGLEKVSELHTNEDQLKTVCLKGVFAQNYVSYEDVASSPLEINKGELRQFTRSDIKPKGMFGPLLQFFTKLIGPSGAAYYNEETNKVPVNNTELGNCQFLVGGSIYAPQWTDPTRIKDAYLVNSRSGFFIRARNDNDQVFLVGVPRVEKQHSEFHQDAIIKSLFPSYFDIDMLTNKL